MTISPARLAANQQNALRSTGPKTAEGKARSRLNAFQHGLAGGGDLVGPDEDLDLIQRRASAFALELDAPGQVGLILAHRAALLSVRMEKCSTRDLIASAAKAQTARDNFDADRLDTLSGWIKSLETPDGGDPNLAILGLEATPAGLTYLIGSWLGLRSAINGNDRVAVDRARIWLGLTATPSTTHLIARIDTEVARLRRQVELLGDAADLVEQGRAEAGLLASFDPSPEATLARRYEAAAERGMYRAIRAIADLRRAPVAEVSPPEVVAAPPPAPSAPPRPVAPLAPLGSFRAEVPASVPSLLDAIALRPEPPLFPPTPRKKRPDLRKLTKKCR